MPQAAKEKSRRKHSDDALWAAVVTRDVSQTGSFFIGVTTTGIYCRPTCTARLPKRENVTFHASAAAAEAAGFRACKRCRPSEAEPNQAIAEKTAQACRLIEDAESPPSLSDLAAAVGLSPSHFHRVFKSATGLTPKAFADAQRNTRVRQALSVAPTVTRAIQEAGFNTNGRFYAGSSEVLGMTPKAFKAGGANTQMTYAIGTCSLGKTLVASTPIGISAVLLGDDEKALLTDLKCRFPKALLKTGGKEFEKHLARVIAIIDHPGQGHSLPLDVQGTVFQHKVWRALRGIPPGTTISYGELAERIGKPKAVRAVASACGANPAAVLIPCHRAVGRNGALSGYRWGIERKRALLAREKK